MAACQGFARFHGSRVSCFSEDTGEQLVGFDCCQYSLEKFIGALVLLPDRQQENSRLCGAQPARDHGPEARGPLKLATSNDLHVLKLGSRVLIMAPSYALFYFASERKSSTR